MTTEFSVVFVIVKVRITYQSTLRRNSFKMADSAKKNSLCEKFECPVCLDYFEIPIRQCVKGHSFCNKCINPQFIKSCPECRQNISEARNYKLEELIESMDFPCENKIAGCKYMLNMQQMANHKLECQYRKMKCEGKLFCGWDCPWEGQEIQEHFKNKHAGHTNLQFNSAVTVGYNSTSNFNDIQLISAHYQLFWYKHRIDINKQRAFWTFQVIGPKIKASKFYYEFEIFVEAPSIRKFKVTEFCDNDVTDTNEIFESEKCVSITLKSLKHFVNDKNEYNFRFRIMRLRKEDGNIKKPTFKSPFKPRH